MKKTTILLSVLMAITVVLSAKSKTVESPSYEFKKSGIYNVTKIELTDSATFLTILSTFIPHWWVEFNDDEVIRDSDTGQEFKIKGIQGAVLNEHLWMPDSGDSAVVLIFPPLPSSVKKIDYQEQIFGISLDNKTVGRNGASIVQPEIEKWMNAELAKAPKSTLQTFESPDFYNESPARLVGCIKGYDERAGFTTGIIYAGNDFTRDDYPVVVTIQPDGRFEAEIPMNKPETNYVVFGNHFIFNYYLEPGQTLAMILDWDEFLSADRLRNVRYKFKQIDYEGPLAYINRELMNNPIESSDYETFAEKRKSMAPMDFKEDQLNELKKQQEKLEDYLRNNKVSDKAQNILLNSVILENVTRLFDYTMNRDYYAKQDTTNEILKLPVPAEYYDFLQTVPLNDQGLMVVKEYGTFINRFEFCKLFNKAQMIVISRMHKEVKIPEKSIWEFCRDEKVELTDEEKAYAKLVEKEEKTEEELDQLKKMNEFMKNFSLLHKELLEKYSAKYVQPLYQQNPATRQIEIWKLKDSILNNEIGLQSSLAYETAKIRSLKFYFEQMQTRENAEQLWAFLQNGITTPYLLKTGEEMLNKAYPENAIAATPIPEGVAGDIFRKIIEPYKGKVVFVDFWATTCGPCVAGIKKMKPVRAKYADNPDFEFVFITDERSSPEQNYNDFVKEQELKNIYRLPKDDYNYLRQLFKFNGIPRYVVIDAKGDVIDDDFSMYRFQDELPRILPKYNL